MKAMFASDAKNQFGRLLDDAAKGPVVIRKHGRDIAVVVSPEEFQRLSDGRAVKADIRLSLERSLRQWEGAYRALA
jgi:prevent-host-death family protein